MSAGVATVLPMVKMDVGAVVKMRTGPGRKRRYIGPMPSFTLAGAS